MAPSGRASFSSRCRTTLWSVVRSRYRQTLQWRARRISGRFLRGPVPLVGWSTMGLPWFLGNPNVYMPCSSTPARWLVPGLFSTTVQPSAVSKSSALAVRSFRGSITRPAHSLSTLRNAGYPIITQDSLPVGGQPLPGGISTHWVPHAISEQLPVAHSKRPGFPGAPRPDPVALA
jgi:hypothetical protein